MKFLILTLVLLSACAGVLKDGPGATTPDLVPLATPAPCAAHGALPDPRCTPGATLDVTVAQLCKPGYASSVRNVPDSEKNQVYAQYGIAHHTTGQYEVDHLISLELGGSNDIANLWPEAAEPRPGFHEKDATENALHQAVCAGDLSLKEAQRIISTDWLHYYSEHVR